MTSKQILTSIVLPSSNIYQIRSQLPLAAYLQVAFKFWKKLVPWAFPKFEKLVIRTFLWTKPMKARAKIYRLQFVSNKFLKCLSPFWPSFLTPVSCFTGISDTFRQFETGKSSYFLKGISEEHWSFEIVFLQNSISSISSQIYELLKREQIQPLNEMTAKPHCRTNLG